MRGLNAGPSAIRAAWSTLLPPGTGRDCGPSEWCVCSSQRAKGFRLSLMLHPHSGFGGTLAAVGHAKSVEHRKVGPLGASTGVSYGDDEHPLRTEKRREELDRNASHRSGGSGNKRGTPNSPSRLRENRPLRMTATCSQSHRVRIRGTAFLLIPLPA